MGGGEGGGVGGREREGGNRVELNCGSHPSVRIW